jgi:hypothetical protein
MDKLYITACELQVDSVFDNDILELQEDSAIFLIANLLCYISFITFSHCYGALTSFQMYD